MTIKIKKIYSKFCGGGMFFFFKFLYRKKVIIFMGLYGGY